MVSISCLHSSPAGSAKCIRTLRESLGKKVFYCTNNSTKSRQEYVEKCEQLGFGGNLVRDITNVVLICKLHFAS